MILFRNFPVFSKQQQNVLYHVAKVVSVVSVVLHVKVEHVSEDVINHTENFKQVKKLQGSLKANQFDIF